MDSASLNSFIPILDDIDRWAELAPVLPVLIVLEVILSADNAVALASISRSLNNIELQRIALNIGIVISLFLRVCILLAANLIIQYPIFKLIASLYLFSLAVRYFYMKQKEENSEQIKESKPNTSLFKVIVLLSITDLAFSIDSVTAAVAISDQILLIITGTLVGVIALRFTADLFIKWLEYFINLETAGYLAVTIVATKLAIQGFNPLVDISDILFFSIIIILLIWGFSIRKQKTI